jgi:hypothetical protein
MDEERVLARLDRIGTLDRSGAAPGELLAELRGLLREAEGPQPRPEAAAEREGVVERLRAAPHGT